MKIGGGVIKFNLEKNPTLLCILDLLRIIVAYLPLREMLCPEMHANEIHELYDRHHKVSPNLNSH